MNSLTGPENPSAAWYCPVFPQDPELLPAWLALIQSNPFSFAFLNPVDFILTLRHTRTPVKNLPPELRLQLAWGINALSRYPKTS